MTNSPAQHEAHDLPLADRIITDLIRDFIAHAADVAIAGIGDDEDDRGFRSGVDQMRHLHLDGVSYRLTPQIIDALRRAGLMVVNP